MPTTIREDTEGQHGWDRIEETYERVEGVDTLTERLTVYDDGKTKTETFGLINRFGNQFTRIEYTDTPHGEGTVWDKIERVIFATDAGNSVIQTVFLDNGMTTQTWRDENNVLRTSLVHDQGILLDPATNMYHNGAYAEFL